MLFVSKKPRTGPLRGRRERLANKPGQRKRLA